LGNAMLLAFFYICGTCLAVEFAARSSQYYAYRPSVKYLECSTAYSF
jgi:hypothetical protein